MEIKYRRERNECYMLVDAGGIDADDYQIRMLEHNRIGGLLRFDCSRLISSRNSVIQYPEDSRWSGSMRMSLSA